MKIRKDPKKFIVYYSPLILLAIGILLFFTYLGFLGNTNCSVIFGVNVAYINIIVLAYILPGAIFIASIYITVYGYKVIRNKYCYPLDIPVLRDKESNITRLCKIKGYLFLLSPLFSLYLINIGDTTYNDLLHNSTKYEFIRTLEKNCDK